ncbi:hypothetical protein B0H17DRAFT_1133453 [Mycena rosella]|uniref:Uncharacterized protein n=1 Tax=Mycena rosella TaxID=1033263 RepID=A0AAD7GFC7_MYCRO|nr:hypothetical protein B0H17DRAFT_1133453 [Mycena rosella]
MLRIGRGAAIYEDPGGSTRRRDKSESGICSCIRGVGDEFIRCLGFPRGAELGVCSVLQTRRSVKQKGRFGLGFRDISNNKQLGTRRGVVENELGEIYTVLDYSAHVGWSYRGVTAFGERGFDCDSSRDAGCGMRIWFQRTYYDAEFKFGRTAGLRPLESGVSGCAGVWGDEISLAGGWNWSRDLIRRVEEFWGDLNGRIIQRQRWVLEAPQMQRHMHVGCLLWRPGVSVSGWLAACASADWALARAGVTLGIARMCGLFNED